jgi:hypothetical protein
MSLGRGLITAAGVVFLAIAGIMIFRPLYWQDAPCGTLIQRYQQLPPDTAIFGGTHDLVNAGCQQYRAEQFPWLAAVAIIGLALLAVGLFAGRRSA